MTIRSEKILEVQGEALDRLSGEVTLEEDMDMS
jgi:hypothetical protein